MNKELKKIIEEERTLYLPHVKTLKNRLMVWFTRAEEYLIFRYMCSLRKADYYKDRSRVMYAIHLRNVNIRGKNLGFYIPAGVLGRGVMIYHGGGIVINSQSVVGDGCVFHGDNCVGNNGKDNLCPILGKKVELGIGAKVIGSITLADGIVVGANAVVTNSFLEPGITVAGVPARRISG